jgi:hypothetical protein
LPIQASQIMTSHRAVLAGLLLPLLLGACAGTPSPSAAQGGIRPATETGPSPAEEWAQRWRAAAPQQGHEQVRKAATAMVDGIRLYDNGDFDAAIARLSEPDVRSSPDPIRVEALKYIAFSYCVTRDMADCRHAFNAALAIDADFELGKGEGGHPMWGPVFDQAKAASENDRARTSLDHARARWRSMDGTWRPW